jgi:hypothetical protein
MTAFDAGRYPEAIEGLMLAEADLRGFSEHKQARYALYRGLAHLALGDAESSERWLAEAKALDDRNRMLLDPQERGRLLCAWRSVGHLPGEYGQWVLQARGLSANSPDR